MGQVKRTRGGRYIHRSDSKNDRTRKAVLTIDELAEQSGHRTAQVFLRYVNAKVSETLRKL
ncbi:MAG: hypothetical protein AB7E55_05780 [Pigmentiphaga sp.]